MSKKTIVTFLKPWRGYGPDEVAGFDKQEADVLVEKGIAQLHGGKKGATKKDQITPPPTDTTPAGGTAAGVDTGSGADNDNDDQKP